MSKRIDKGKFADENCYRSSIVQRKALVTDHEVLDRKVNGQGIEEHRLAMIQKYFPNVKRKEEPEKKREDENVVMELKRGSDFVSTPNSEEEVAQRKKLIEATKSMDAAKDKVRERSRKRNMVMQLIGEIRRILKARGQV
jgi:DNA repair exonuclease SbcCD nuclease subunit